MMADDEAPCVQVKSSCCQHASSASALPTERSVRSQAARGTEGTPHSQQLLLLLLQGSSGSGMIEPLTVALLAAGPSILR